METPASFDARTAPSSYPTDQLHVVTPSLLCTYFGKELHLGVKPYQNGCLCPECGQRGWIVRPATDERTWTDIAVFGLQVILHYAPKEIACRTHGRIQGEIPWAAVRARVSSRLEFRVCALSQIMTQKAASEILKMPSSKVSDILHRVIPRVRSGHKIRGLVTLGVDEEATLAQHAIVSFAPVARARCGNAAGSVSAGSAPPPRSRARPTHARQGRRTRRRSHTVRAPLAVGDQAGTSNLTSSPLKNRRRSEGEGLCARSRRRTGNKPVGFVEDSATKSWRKGPARSRRPVFQRAARA